MYTVPTILYFDSRVLDNLFHRIFIAEFPQLCLIQLLCLLWIAENVQVVGSKPNSKTFCYSQSSPNQQTSLVNNTVSHQVNKETRMFHNQFKTHLQIHDFSLEQLYILYYHSQFSFNLKVLVQKGIDSQDLNPY